MDIQQSIEIMKSLADTSRLHVINSLFEKPQYVEELSNRLNLAASTVSFHLKKLEKAGLVSKIKEQYYFVYKINDEILNLTLRKFISFENLEKFNQEKRITDYRNKVIKSFFKKNKLIKLPVQHKKRLIILDEIINSFEIGKKYDEPTLDKIINKFFDDHCTIRRLFIEEGMMKRENSIYERIMNKIEVRND
ncbi:MAG: metalloregulator ArsR/SmtB family transcription factor [Ignavibacteria bacterium]|jgi:predicted transcriptional regulator|nr:metalloregulator ArsR/SmtB family transcription factor [Ignavibacteria bacterium]